MTLTLTITQASTERPPPSIPAAGEAVALQGLSLLQTAAYGMAKAASTGWRLDRGLFTDGSRTVGTFQAIVRTLPVIGGGLAWVNRGPLWTSSDGTQGPAMAAAMLEQLRRHYVADHGMCLRIAPAWPDGGVGENVYRDAGFTITDVPGWASAVVDLRRSRDELRAALHAKWRNGLTRAESEANLIIREAVDAPAMERFLTGYGQHLQTHDYSTNLDAPFIRRLQEVTPAHEKLTFFTVERAGHTLGGLAMARYGSTAEYLAGFNATAGRDANVGQLMVWAAMMTAKDQSLSRFDLGGMDPDVTPPGIYRFKNRVGGVPYRLAPEIEADNGGLVSRLVRWRVARARASA